MMLRDRDYVERLLSALLNQLSMVKAGGQRKTLEQILAVPVSPPPEPEVKP